MHRLAFWLGVLVALLPIAYVASRHLPRRWRWMREAAAAQQLLSVVGDTRLFALRAMTSLPLYELARVSADPVGDLVRGEHHALAAYELHRLGLRPRRNDDSVPRPSPSAQAHRSDNGHCGQGQRLIRPSRGQRRSGWRRGRTRWR